MGGKGVSDPRWIEPTHLQKKKEESCMAKKNEIWEAEGAYVLTNGAGEVEDRNGLGMMSRIILETLY
ncbi:hypothetical protein SK128_013371, partial [Halocaridina rubra]